MPERNLFLFYISHFNHTFQGMVKVEEVIKGALSHLWLTCRVIANENRLRLLWLIFEDSSLCVGDLAAEVGITPATASNQLRILCDEGFIVAHRSGMQVFYAATSTSAPPHILSLLEALRKSWAKSVPFTSILHQATGFTHQRRIELAKQISAADLPLNDLLDKTVMSYSALSRHLHKLQTRGYIDLSNGKYRLANPDGQLARSLLKIISG